MATILKISLEPLLNGKANWPQTLNQIAYRASVGLGNQSMFMGSGPHNQDGYHAHI